MSKTLNPIKNRNNSVSNIAEAPLSLSLKSRSKQTPSYPYRKKLSQQKRRAKPLKAPISKERANEEKVAAFNKLTTELNAFYDGKASISAIQQVIDLVRKLNNQPSVMVKSSAGDDFIRLMTGNLNSDETEKSQIEEEIQRRAFAWRAELLRDTDTAPEVAKKLDTTRQTPHDRRRSNTLLGVKDKGIWRFPRWQFDPKGDNGVVKGLPQVLEAFHPDTQDIIKARWFNLPQPCFQGLTPLDVLKKGSVEDIENLVACAAEVPAA